jgi:hypothetical protein
MALSPAAVLLLNAFSGAAPADITPTVLATEPRILDFGDARYDWALQRRDNALGTQLATQTAHCNTKTGTTNNGRDDVPDCGFD